MTVCITIAGVPSALVDGCMKFTERLLARFDYIMTLLCLLLAVVHETQLENVAPPPGYLNELTCNVCMTVVDGLICLLNF